MAGHSDGGGKSASFEGAGGVKAFVFDEDVGVFAAAQHGGEPFAERDRRGFRKYCIVAPHRRNERQQRCRRKSFFDGGEVVARIKNSTIFRANGLRTIGRIMLAATGAFEVRGAGHGESLTGGERGITAANAVAQAY